MTSATVDKAGSARLFPLTLVSLNFRLVSLNFRLAGLNFRLARLNFRLASLNVRVVELNVNSPDPETSRHAVSFSPASLLLYLCDGRPAFRFVYIHDYK